MKNKRDSSISDLHIYLFPDLLPQSPAKNNKNVKHK